MKTRAGTAGESARKWSSVVLGLGISIPVTLAPLLGKLNVPGFTPLLALIPDDIQNMAIPLSAAAMSLVATSVEFRAIRKASKARLLREAKRSLLHAGICLAALGAAYALLVTRVNFGKDESVAFVTGFVHPTTAPCGTISAEQCIRQFLMLDTSRIKSYYGDQQIRLANILLVGLYVLFFAIFGNLVGILVSTRQSDR